ncbi:bifunctional oligoribonuclease/PAP phosphatase NrnA [Mycoplasmopsis anatis]|uniref:DHH family phosphoesterase n=1 Tax=Mycoplasmopsis anatis TaxID=171279 RepID=UPI001C4E2326|nr:bifunctional oligoribonuclease/PAP phosphatase NrnA [Mycoplasmopsis anatis]MBW0595428.1 bifunctional oligoribonuclease/PAP phosphatase NrnA [Mycoplasmopsis anatis]MBW0602015.1 bifunctional oligoribonuclease/PAP phosphatase NrnA [Mycoplasmopsis anatis]
MLVGNEKIATELLEKYDSIVIFHHIRPDGDCLGSQFGLKELLETNYPNKKVYAIGDAKGNFSFLDIVHDPIPSDEILSKSLGVIVDANFKERIECREVLDKNLFPETLRIDHHPNDDDLDKNSKWVDSSYIAADEMIAQLAFVNNWKITKKAANLLYLGINTDSGRFLYDKTSARTFKLVAHLYESGLESDFIHSNLSKTSLNEIQFNSWLVSTLKVNGQVAYIKNSLEETLKFNKTPQSSIRVNSIGNIEGYPIWVQFTEEEDHKIRVELRSNGPLVNVVARKWNGGGHDRASGCILDSFDQIDALVADCNAEVIRYQSESK